MDVEQLMTEKTQGTADRKITLMGDFNEADLYTVAAISALLNSGWIDAHAFDAERHGRNREVTYMSGDNETRPDYRSYGNYCRGVFSTRLTP